MKKILTGVLFISVFFSCKKEKNDSTSKSKTTLLTQAAWKPTKVERRTATTDAWEINNFSTDPCNTDNVTTFTSGLVYSVDDGAVKCNPANPQTVESGTYSFTNNEAHLDIIITSSGFNLEEDCAIEQLDDNTLIYNYYFPGGPYYRVSMSH